MIQQTTARPISSTKNQLHNPLSMYRSHPIKV